MMCDCVIMRAMTQSSPTYLDYAATTPLDTRVLQAMLPYFQQDFGNPSSIHRHGQKAEAAIEASRDRIAECLVCQAEEVIFTSCGSESDNLALRGTAMASRQQRDANHILISPVEHHAISHTAEQLAHVYGFEVETLPVDLHGKVSPDDVKHRLRPDTAIVSVIYANNEIGTINPIKDIAAICHDRQIPFHTDAVQAGAYLELDVKASGVDLLSLGAHKFYGPKGVGVLYVREGTPLTPTQTGGGQEFGLRAGTQNVPYIVGMKEALHLAQTNRAENIASILPMRDRLIGRVLEEIPNAILTGHPSDRLANHASFVFENVDGNALLMLLDQAGYACSSGSACKTGNPSPSEVLIALGIERSWALGSLRVTLGSTTTPAIIDAFCDTLTGMITRLRKLNPHG